MLSTNKDTLSKQNSHPLRPIQINLYEQGKNEKSKNLSASKSQNTLHVKPAEVSKLIQHISSKPLNVQVVVKDQQVQSSSTNGSQAKKDPKAKNLEEENKLLRERLQATQRELESVSNEYKKFKERCRCSSENQVIECSERQAGKGAGLSLKTSKKDAEPAEKEGQTPSFRRPSQPLIGRENSTEDPTHATQTLNTSATSQNAGSMAMANSLMNLSETEKEAYKNQIVLINKMVNDLILSLDSMRPKTVTSFNSIPPEDLSHPKFVGKLGKDANLSGNSQLSPTEKINNANLKKNLELIKSKITELEKFRGEETPKAEPERRKSPGRAVSSGDARNLYYNQTDRLVTPPRSREVSTFMNSQSMNSLDLTPEKGHYYKGEYRPNTATNGLMQKLMNLNNIPQKNGDYMSGEDTNLSSSRRLDTSPSNKSPTASSSQLHDLKEIHTKGKSALTPRKNSGLAFVSAIPNLKKSTSSMDLRDNTSNGEKNNGMNTARDGGYPNLERSNLTRHTWMLGSDSNMLKKNGDVHSDKLLASKQNINNYWSKTNDDKTHQPCRDYAKDLEERLNLQETQLNQLIINKKDLLQRLDRLEGRYYDNKFGTPSPSNSMNDISRLLNRESSQPMEGTERIRYLEDQVSQLRGQLEELRYFIRPSAGTRNGLDSDCEDDTQDLKNDQTPEADKEKGLNTSFHDECIKLQTENDFEGYHGVRSLDSLDHNVFEEMQMIVNPENFIQKTPLEEPIERVQDERINEIERLVKREGELLKQKGVKECGLVVGIDCTTSNIFTGKKSFGNRHLHHISPRKLNFYERVISIMGGIVDTFSQDGRFPVYLFGDEATRDQTVRPLYQDKSGYCECFGVSHALAEYRKQIPKIGFSGPTSFRPLIETAIQISKIKKQFQLLIIIGDGGVTDMKETIRTIVKASNFPIFIIMVGVGDGDFKKYPKDPWQGIKQLEQELPRRRFANFFFIPFNKGIEPKEFAQKALDKVPEAYSYCVENNMI